MMVLPIIVGSIGAIVCFPIEKTSTLLYLSTGIKAMLQGEKNQQWYGSTCDPNGNEHVGDHSYKHQNWWSNDFLGWGSVWKASDLCNSSPKKTLGQQSQGHGARSPSYAIVEGRGDVVFLGAAATMEHEEEGLRADPG